MEALLTFAEGPLLRLTLAVMILGLLRHLVLLSIGMGQALMRASDPVPPFAAPFSKLAKTTLKWLIPFSHFGTRPAYSVVSFVFHVGLILVPVFLFGHVELWRENIGIGWITMPQISADVLTLLVIALGVALYAMRVGNRNARFLSRKQDYWLPWLLIIPFITGFLTVHPAVNPVPYEEMRLMHVLSAELIFVLTPFTKIIHCVFYPLVHFASNYAWRLAPDAGENVWKTLGKEGRV